MSSRLLADLNVFSRAHCKVFSRFFGAACRPKSVANVQYTLLAFVRPNYVWDDPASCDWASSRCQPSRTEDDYVFEWWARDSTCIWMKRSELACSFVTDMSWDWSSVCPRDKHACHTISLETEIIHRCRPPGIHSFCMTFIILQSTTGSATTSPARGNT